METLRVTKNFLKSNLQITRYITEGVSNQIINRKDELTRRKNALKITAKSCRTVLKYLNAEVEVHGLNDGLFDRNYFMVCNHMSYLDILVLSSVQPASFVTSVEMEKTFFLGDMAKLGGSFFVDRVNRRKMKQEVQALVDLLNSGINVFIFPEGTSTNGQKLLPFKKSLFRVPFLADFPIMPICLKYKQIDGEPFSETNCDKVCWHGDMTFAPHYMQLMGIKNLKAELTYLDPLYPKDFESHGDLAQTAQQQIESIYYSHK